MLLLGKHTVNSLLQVDTLRNWKKCLLVGLSAYKNYSHKRTPKKNMVHVHSRESYISGC